jgi:hypothetical protein
MRSRFRTWLLFLLMLTMPAFLAAVALFWAVLYQLIGEGKYNRDMLIGIMPIMLTVFLFVIIREIRYKWSSIEIKDDVILVRRFFGFGKFERFELNGLNGFTRSSEPSRIASGFTLNIYHNTIRVIEISDTPYNNVSQLYRRLGRCTKNLGDESYQFKRVLWNAFGRPIRLGENAR